MAEEGLMVRAEVIRAEAIGPRPGQPKCLFCRSTDTMPPYRRPEHVFLLSRILHVRWRLCRTCARHFIAGGRPRARA